MRLSQSNAGASGRLGGVGGGGGGAGGRGTSGGDGGRAGVADGSGPAAGGAWTGRGGGGDAGGGAVGSGRSATRGSGTDSGAGGGTGLATAGGTGVGGTTGATGRVGSGRTVAAGGGAGGDGAASRDRWLTRARRSSISFSCDSTTCRSVSSRRAVLRADTQATIGRTKGTTSRISAKKRISTVPRSRAGGGPPGCESLVAGVQSSYTEPTSLISSPYRTPQAACRPREKP
jgi:hypothetical protein